LATVDHNSLTGSNLHEPKGAATADANEVYVANGSGSGVWTAIQDIYTVEITDVSTADNVYIVAANAGTVSKVVTLLAGSISVANSTVTCYNSAGASMGTLTIAFSGSSSGDIDTLSPVSNNTVAANSYIRINTDGASSTATRLYVTVVVDRT